MSLLILYAGSKTKTKNGQRVPVVQVFLWRLFIARSGGWDDACGYDTLQHVHDVVFLVLVCRSLFSRNVQLAG